MKIRGTFYLNGGGIVKEIINTDDYENLETPEKIQKFIDDLRSLVKSGFKDRDNGQISFGFSIIKLADLSAITLNEVTDNIDE